MQAAALALQASAVQAAALLAMQTSAAAVQSTLFLLNCLSLIYVY